MYDAQTGSWPLRKAVSAGETPSRHSRSALAKPITFVLPTYQYPYSRLPRTTSGLPTTGRSSLYVKMAITVIPTSGTLTDSLAKSNPDAETGVS